MLQIFVFLDPRSTSSETEAPFYDLLSLLGDVGGYLGLLVGGGALALYDLACQWAEAKQRTVEKKLRRLRRKVKGGTAGMATTTAPPAPPSWPVGLLLELRERQRKRRKARKEPTYRVRIETRPRSTM